jgi:outer membrane biosynthesis protein TonB
MLSKNQENEPIVDNEMIMMDQTN